MSCIYATGFYYRTFSPLKEGYWKQNTEEKTFITCSAQFNEQNNFHIISTCALHLIGPLLQSHCHEMSSLIHNTTLLPNGNDNLSAVSDSQFSIETKKEGIYALAVFSSWSVSNVTVRCKDVFAANTFIILLIIVDCPNNCADLWCFFIYSIERSI